MQGLLVFESTINWSGRRYMGKVGKREMKTLRISDDIHRKLTASLGTLMAQTGKMQTYQDAINAMLNQSVLLPPEMLTQIQNFVEENKHLGFTTKEEIIRDAIRFRLQWLKGEHQFIEIPKEQYEQLDEAVKEMRTPYSDAEDFVIGQVREALEKYEEWKQSRKKR
jgi:Arc/MetJ-type ribon-helix-helix transcriptional regulator